MPANNTSAVHYPGTRLRANAAASGLSTTADAAVHACWVSDAIARLPNHTGNAVSDTAAWLPSDTAVSDAAPWLSNAVASGLPADAVAPDLPADAAAPDLPDAGLYDRAAMPDASAGAMSNAAVSHAAAWLPDAAVALSDADSQCDCLHPTPDPESTAVCSFTCSGMRWISRRSWRSS